MALTFRRQRKPVLDFRQGKSKASYWRNRNGGQIEMGGQMECELPLCCYAIRLQHHPGRGPTAGHAEPPRPRLRLAISGFTDGGNLPLTFTCYNDGGNAQSPPENAMSPPFSWANVPKGTASLCLR